MSEILTDELTKKAKTLEAKEYRTGVLWNDKDKLTFEPLPTEAQFAPVYAIAVVDANNDGKKDLILGGNDTRTRVRMGKIDANRGQLFLNGGNRKFTYIPQNQSGLRLEGDIRAMIYINPHVVAVTREGQLFDFRR
jgi:hypothetical protein